MGFIESTFEKMDIQKIINFLMYDSGDSSEDNASYETRLKNESTLIDERLRSIYGEGNELDEAFADLGQAFDGYATVYMEIGMKAGAKLLFQLLGHDV